MGGGGRWVDKLNNNIDEATVCAMHFHPFFHMVSMKLVEPVCTPAVQVIKQPDADKTFLLDHEYDMVYVYTIWRG